MKPKVIRQVLMSIVRFLSGVSCPHKEATHVMSALIENATLTSLSLIYSDSQRSSTRAAMNLCETLLTKRLVSVNLLCQAISKASNVTGSCKDVHSDAPLCSGHARPGDLIEDFVTTLIRWVQYADTGPSSGRLLKRFFIFLQHPARPDFLLNEDPEVHLPLWVRPLKQTVLLHPYLHEAIGNHILPDLLQVDYADSLKFLDSLPLAKLQGSDFAEISVDDIQFCLSIVAILQEKGLDQLIADLGLHSLDKSSDISSESIRAAEIPTSAECLNVEKLSTQLLIHENPSISIASLSILTFSSSHTKPFSEEVLASLKQNLPSFHGESDSKVRGDFISVVRRILRRLGSALIRLSHTSTNSRHMNNLTVTSSWNKTANEDDRMRNEALHRSFLSWYIGYLAGELQPTASYQRHITSLRVLQIMQTSMLLENSQVRLLSPSSMQTAESIRLTQVYCADC